MWYVYTLYLSHNSRHYLGFGPWGADCNGAVTGCHDFSVQGTRRGCQDTYPQKSRDPQLILPRRTRCESQLYPSPQTPQVKYLFILFQAIGTLADKTPQTGDVLSGLLVAKDYSYTLLDPRDLRDFAGLSTCTVTQRQTISLGVGWELVRWHLEGMYGRVDLGVDKDGVPTMRVSASFFLFNAMVIRI